MKAKHNLDEQEKKLKKAIGGNGKLSSNNSRKRNYEKALNSVEDQDREEGFKVMFQKKEERTKKQGT